MAFTTPGTAVAGEVLTAAFWNTNVRDNTEFLKTQTDKIGLALVHSSSFSAATTINVDGVFSSAYRNYRIIIGAASTATAGATNIGAQMRVGGVPAAGANYVFLRNATNGDGTTSILATTGGTSWGPFALSNGTNASSQPAYSCVDLLAPFIAEWTGLNALNHFANNTTSQTAACAFGGMHRQGTSYDGIGFSIANASTGTIRIYGYVD
jgi:hypothetical protein